MITPEDTQPFGKYTLLRRIAKGGMAEIFLASQQGPAGFQKELVIKRILPHLASDEAFITMFLDEARLAARLNHPNIVQIHELGEEAGAYYIAMEYVKGPNLSSVIRKLREHGLRLPLHYAAWIVSRAAAGLEFAHSLTDDTGHPVGLVHRDISPDNIIVTEQGAVKMIDFGVAKARSNETKTVAGTIKGKLSYMSPEQVQGKSLDGRSDIFSLGIVLYELTTLRRPFGGSSELATVSAIITDPPEPPSRVLAGYPRALEKIVERALQKDREQRCPSARELQADLETFIHTRGQYLTDREIGEFLSRLFSGSDEELAALRDLPSGLHTAIQPERSSELALAHEKTQALPRPAVGGRDRGRLVGGIVAVALALILGGLALWFFVLSPREAGSGGTGGPAGGSDDAVAAVAPDAGPAPHRRDPEGTRSARRELEGTAADGAGEPRGEPRTADVRQGIVSTAPDVSLAPAGTDAGGAVAAAPDAGQHAAMAPDVSPPAPDVPPPAPDVPPPAPDVPPPVPDVPRPPAPDVVVAAVVDVAEADDVPQEDDVPAAVDDAADESPDALTPARAPTRSWLLVRGPWGSTVFIDGRSYGARVNKKIAVSPGRHQVVVRLRGTTLTRKATVRVDPGKTLTVSPD